MTELVDGAGEVVAMVPGTERSVHQRLVAILAELPAIGKTTLNPQQKFMYRSHDDVLNALNPLLAKHGVYVVPDVIDRVTAQRETARGSVMYEVNLHVRYTFLGVEGDWVTASAWGEGTDMGDKATNKAMTMAFKAVLGQVFAVSTEETVDADGGTPEETVRRDKREFDPGVDLLENAIRPGPKAMEAIVGQLKLASPTLDWARAMSQAVEMTWPDSGVSNWRELPVAPQQEFWRRLTNASAKLVDAMGGGDFPPVSDAQIQETLAWAFKGNLVEIAHRDVETPSRASEGSDGGSGQKSDPAAKEGEERAGDGED